ncbi:isochorismatase family protein [Acerihabitans sp. KWT182]|uniref:Isochorismatase family protein n=1 Tax=Acerihabitans sp. KWT182 TaxID=3157919 RepID=A0AAU7Q9J6_9GAMM
MAQTALLIIDVQASFLHRPYWSEENLSPFKQALAALIEGCRRQGALLADIFHDDGEWPFNLASGLVTRLPFLTHTADVTVYKHVHNALTESGLHPWLQERQVNHLIIAGLRTEQCCETTARVASDLGYRVTFVTEATLTFPMSHAGRTVSSDELKFHTETVLKDRFAAIRDVSGCLAELAADR